MMTSQHRTRILRFPENSFINEYLTSKFLLFFIFIFLSPFLHEIDDVTTLSQNFKILRERFHKGIIYLKVPFTFDSDLLTNIGTWNTKLDLFHSFFGLMSSTQEVKTTKFWDSDFRIECFTFRFLTIDFHLSVFTGTWNTSLDPSRESLG